MNRRDFVGLFSKALAGATFLPGVTQAECLPIPDKYEDAPSPMSMEWRSFADYFGAMCIACRLSFTDGYVALNAVKVYPYDGRSSEEMEMLGRGALEDWAVQRCIERGGVEA